MSNAPTVTLKEYQELGKAYEKVLKRSEKRRILINILVRERRQFRKGNGK